MAVKIFYFTGTGNSLEIAQRLATGLGGAEVERICGKPANGRGFECVGIIYPVYMWHMPLMVEDFLKGLEVDKNAYVFAVADGGGSSGAALNETKKSLNSRGINLASGFFVRMPGNYIPMYEGYSPEKQKELFNKAEQKIGNIVEAIKQRSLSQPEEQFFPISRALTLVFKLFARPKLKSSDKKFIVSDKCIKCGTCYKICPADNIRLDSGKPVWQGRCEQCMACLQWCPVEAINYGRKTEGRRRYRNPKIKAENLLLR
jgi:ferredoxin/flavodoxin